MKQKVECNFSNKTDHFKRHCYTSQKHSASSVRKYFLINTTTRM